MMQFFKYTLATILGIIITTFLAFLLFIGILSFIAGSSDKEISVDENSVYEIELSGVLVDRSQNDELSGVFSSMIGESPINEVGLDDLLANIHKAKEDSNIKGIYLKGGTMQAGYASLAEIRNALMDFKKSGKFIIAYADHYLQSNYYLASVADKVLLNPQGMIEFKGLSANVMFFKNTLDKIGVEMQVVKVGQFKSAVEPFVTTQMSDSNKVQVTAYIQSIWNELLHEISSSRKIPISKLTTYADEMMMFQPTEKALQYKFVDALVYADEVEAIIKKYTMTDYATIDHQSYNQVPANLASNENKVAVIYALGAIDDGDMKGIISEELIKTIQEVEDDNAIQAVVLRVSSPGGSAYGSEQIWRALSLLKKKKTLVVSMGDVAASGGYYISCLADAIVAQPNTITGSIGIFGLIPNISGLNDKIGLTYDGVKTNKMSDAIDINRPFTPEEKTLMQNYVNRGYELFVKRCADGRHQKIEKIKQIAEGRVWTGSDALKIGLVDALGGLDKAITLAAQKAMLKNYEVVEYPFKEDFSTRLFKSLGEDIETRIVKASLGENYTAFQQITKVQKLNGIQARMPYQLIVK